MTSACLYQMLEIIFYFMIYHRAFGLFEILVCVVIISIIGILGAKSLLYIYKKYEINPLSGCLFSFLQIPVFLAFYEALNRLPVIFEGNFLGLQLGTTPITGIGAGKYYYILIIALVIATSYLSMKLNSTAATSKEQQAQMKMVTNMMIVFLGIASVSLSTSIAIYWITNSTFTILQNLWVKRRKDVNAKN